MTKTLAASRTDRVSSATTMTRSRGKRSPSMAANGEAIAEGVKRTRPTMPTGAAPARRVGKNGQGDPVRPVGDDRDGPRALDPADVGIVEDATERARGVAEPLPQRACHRGSIPRGRRFSKD